MMAGVQASRWWRYVPYFLVAGVFAWTLTVFQVDVARIDFSKLSDNWPVLFTLAVLALVSYVVRSLRWQLMLRHLGHKLPTGFALITYLAGFAFTLAPGKVGELAKYLYYRNLRIPLTGVMGAYSVERLIDLVVFVSLALIGLGASAGGHGFTLIMAGLAVPLVLLAIAVLPLAWFDNLLLGARSKRWSFLSHGVSMLRSARSSMHPKSLTLVLVLGFVGWTAESLTLHAAGYLFTNWPIGAVQALGIYATAIVIGAISFLPGGLGTTEIAMVILLNNAGVPMPDAMLATIVCRVLTLWFAIILGWLSVLVLRLNTIANTGTLPRV